MRRLGGYLLAAMAALGCQPEALDVFAAVRGDAGAGGASGDVAGSGGGGAGSAGTRPVVIIDRGGGSQVPDNVEELFAPTEGQGVGPCLVEPELGALLPRDWLRPRFRFIAAQGQSLFELRLRAGIELDWVVYTSSTTWTMPSVIWAELAATEHERQLSISVRGLDSTRSPATPSLATTGSITIAPVEVGGEIVYFTSTGSSALKAFDIAGETIRESLLPTQTNGKCVACHATTPDRELLAVSVSSDAKGGDPAHLELVARDGGGQKPAFLSAQASALLAREKQHLPTFSPAHFAAGDRVLLSILEGRLIWTDLEATSLDENDGWGELARTGDANATVTHPDFNHEGTALAYTSIGAPSTVAVADETDVFIVPYGDRAGGRAEPLSGASTPEHNEYYPAFSPDDELLAFTRTTRAVAPADPLFPFAPTTSTYANPHSELFVVAASGGVPQRLAANDPPACSGRASPGVTNSWAKWSPVAQSADGKRYYFLAFSSSRADAKLNQLYGAALVVDASGQLTSYPALYFWNQPEQESNHQPVWLTVGP